MGDDEIRGYYSLSWNGGNKGPKNSNTSVFFNGWNNVRKGLDEYDPSSQPALVGFKYFSFGGDDGSGVLTESILKRYIKDIPRITDFDGVMFDIEIVDGNSGRMIKAFAEAFKATKDAGLTVGITTSHTAPVEVSTKQDAIDYIKAFVKDPSVDVISPQLYTVDNETEPDFQPTGDCADIGCTWDLYKEMRPGMKFAPSFTYAKLYSKVQKYFQDNYDIKCSGYFVYYENDRLLII